MTAESENDTTLRSARAFFPPPKAVGRGCVSRVSVKTKSRPMTSTMPATAYFSQTPTSFMPKKTTPAPST